MSGSGDQQDQAAGSGVTPMSRKRSSAKALANNADTSGDESSLKGGSAAGGSRLKQRREGKTTRKSQQTVGTKVPKFKSSKESTDLGKDASLRKRRKSLMSGSSMMQERHRSAMNFTTHAGLQGSARGFLLRGPSYAQEESKSSATSGLMSQKPSHAKFFKNEDDEDEEGVEYARITGGDGSEDDE